MLMLSRRDGEGLVLILPDERRVRVVLSIRKRANRQHTTRIGVEAPADVIVLRDELLEQYESVPEARRAVRKPRTARPPQETPT